MEITLLMTIQVSEERTEQRVPAWMSIWDPLHMVLAGDSMAIKAPNSCGSAFLGLCPLASVFCQELRIYQAELCWKCASLAHSLMLPLGAPPSALFCLLIFSLVSPGILSPQITQKSLYMTLLQHILS